MSESKRGLFDEIQKALGYKTNSFIKKGVHEGVISRWKKTDKFSGSTRIVLKIFIEELNKMKEKAFITFFVEKWSGQPNKSKIQQQILGMRKYMQFDKSPIPNWLTPDLAEEIFKKVERKWENRK